VHIIGTAGHVDHGKSALVAALTGTNPDRWTEERERGMTLDLGFAHLRFEDGVEGGIVDVPGHERFLHNMLAGAAGMELLLLVVDVNEGVMPQTLEHLAILQFLNARRVLVVASKVDLYSGPAAEACRRIAEQLRGTIAEDAPIFPVSVVTGENLDALRHALHQELAAMPPRRLNAPAYLPIDRAFVLPGLGTVVTGTLMQGSITIGETLALQPGGIPAHVRGLEVFGAARERVEAGARVALSLPGIDRSEVARGQAIVGPELGARQTLRVHFVPLAAAIPVLRKRTPVRAYFGSAEVLGTLVAPEAASASEMRAELHLREPVVAFPGLRFVLRRPSPMTLLGGGFVEVGDAALFDEPATSDEEMVLALLGERKLEPVDVNTIAFAVNLRAAAVLDALERLVERGNVIAVSRPPAYVDGAAARALLARVLAHLEAAHRDEPWAMGTTSLALARSLGVAEALFVRVLEPFVGEGRLVNRDGYYGSVDHEPSFTPEQLAFFDHLVPVDESRPFLPIPFASVAAAVKLSQLFGVPKAFDTMLARGALVKVGGDLYRGSQMLAIRARVETLLGERQRMTASQFRDLLGTSRKYAVPLLEWLDSHAVTVRDGDYRMLRRGSG
jgi:selenocysteine-specific elongation factor